MLGHVQRGGIPSSWDRIAATAFGVHAVDMLAKGETYRMAAWQHGEVTDVSLEDVGKIGTQKVEKDSVMLQTAIGMDMYVGEL